MRKKSVFLFLGLVFCAVGSARAEWVDLSKNLADTDIQTLAIDPKDPKQLYAASQKRVYKSMDAGEHWKQILGVRGTDNQIHKVLVDPKDSHRVYVASERGIQRSFDGGKTWDTWYRGMGDRAKAVYDLAGDVENSDTLWAGTANGLVKIIHGDPKIIGSIPAVKVFSVMTLGVPGTEQVWVTTEKGIYRSADSGAHWDRMFVETLKSKGDTGETSLSQFQIEELAVAPAMSNLIRVPGRDSLLAASPRGIWEGVKNGDQWTELKNDRLPDRRINYLAGSAETFYGATDRGAVRWRNENKTSKDISDGLGSKEVKMLAYDSGSGDLFAATQKGVFRFPKPDFKPSDTVPAVTVFVPHPPANAQEILGRFENEPTILEIQNATIRYAEVHPDKIKAWREAAAQKAWMPTLSFTTNASADQNVDIDRGGTNDPDKFIVGPKEQSFDWHAGVSWNLGDLIWNDDQTSIDTRSKLMVELRDDVLNEVTHLYYERRRLQVEMALIPAKELPLVVERQLKLDELTAGIDALTGGYFSSHLERVHA